MNSNNPTLTPRLVHLFKNSRSERYGFTNAYNYKVGNYIKAVVPDFPAEKMGIQVDDIIFEVNGHDVLDLNVQGVSKLINKFPTQTSLLVLSPNAADYYKMNEIAINGQMEGILESVDWPEWVKVAEKKVAVAETEINTQHNVEEEPQTVAIVTGSISENLGQIRHIENEIISEQTPDTEIVPNQNDHFNQTHASMSRMEKALLGIQELLVEIRDKLSASHAETTNTDAERTVNSNEAGGVKTEETESAFSATPQAVDQHVDEQEQKLFKDWVDITMQ